MHLLPVLRTAVLIAVLFGAASASDARTRVTASQGATIWPKGSYGSFVAKLCSRSHPVSTGGEWTPTWKDVAMAETRLPLEVRAWRNRPEARYFLPPSAFEAGPWRANFNRSYFGIRRGRQRILYIDFAHHRHRDGRDICDGGPGFFGVEMDVRTGRLLSVQTNGIG